MVKRNNSIHYWPPGEKHVAGFFREGKETAAQYGEKFESLPTSGLFPDDPEVVAIDIFRFACVSYG